MLHINQSRRKSHRLCTIAYSVRLTISQSVGNSLSIRKKLPSIHFNSRFMRSNQFSFSYRSFFSLFLTHFSVYFIAIASSVHAATVYCCNNIIRKFKLEKYQKIAPEKKQFQITWKMDTMFGTKICTHQLKTKNIPCTYIWIELNLASAEPYSYNFPTNTSCVNWNQYYTNCSQLGGNPFQSTISFDNIGMVTSIFLYLISTYIT